MDTGYKQQSEFAWTHTRPVYAWPVQTTPQQNSLAQSTTTLDPDPTQATKSCSEAVLVHPFNKPFRLQQTPTEQQTVGIAAKLVLH
jgi:hypothetical protein